MPTLLLRLAAAVAVLDMAITMVMPHRAVRAAVGGQLTPVQVAPALLGILHQQLRLKVLLALMERLAAVLEEAVVEVVRHLLGQ